MKSFDFFILYTQCEKFAAKGTGSVKKNQINIDYSRAGHILL